MSNQQKFTIRDLSTLEKSEVRLGILCLGLERYRRGEDLFAYTISSGKLVEDTKMNFMSLRGSSTPASHLE